MEDVPITIKQCEYLNSKFCTPTKYKWTVTSLA